MRPIIIFIFLFTIKLSAAQKIYSLDECITTALKNNNTVKLQLLTQEDAKIDLFSAKQNKLPTADAGWGHGLNFGRSIDPSTNDFVNERIARGGFSGGASWTIWRNNAINHQIKQSQFAEEATKWAVKNEEDKLRLQVILSYLRVLNTKELYAIAVNQQKNTEEQWNRLDNMNKQGAILPGQLADIAAQLASDKMSVLSAQQDIKSSTLALTQLMNVSYDPMMEVQALPAELDPIQDISTARSNLSKHAFVRSSEYAMEAAHFNLKSAMAYRYPSINLSTDLGSNYSSAFKVNNENVGYFKQLSNNFNYSGYVSVGIPILGRSAFVRRDIKRAQNSIERAKANAALAQTFIQQNIEEAILLYQNSTERLTLAQNQTNAFAESFRIAEVRLNEGVANSIVEYLLAKNNFNRAQNQLVAAKYENSFRKKVVDFYAKLD